MNESLLLTWSTTSITKSLTRQLQWTWLPISYWWRTNFSVLHFAVDLWLCRWLICQATFRYLFCFKPFLLINKQNFAILLLYRHDKIFSMLEKDTNWTGYSIPYSSSNSSAPSTRSDSEIDTRLGLISAAILTFISPDCAHLTTTNPCVWIENWRYMKPRNIHNHFNYS